jgi:hypothetical protein
VRPAGWEHLLAEHIAAARAGSFRWGTHDCALWCADWVRAITGHDPAEEFRGRYGTEVEATRILGELGYTDLSSAVCAKLSKIPVPLASRGDVLMHPQGMLGICDGPHAIFLTFSGVLRAPFLHCANAWEV